MINRNVDENRMQTMYTLDGMKLELPNSFVKRVDICPNRINPFIEQGTTQQFPLGTRLTWGSRIFRYALNGNATAAVGKLMQSVVPLAGHIDEAINEPAAESTTIAFTPNTVTTDDMAANQFADGFLWINDDTGEGYLHEIKSHPAIVGGVSGTITLKDPIQLLCGPNATATILQNPWYKVIIHPSPPTAMVAGVPVAAITANYYCWLQVGGPCAVLIDGTVVAGDHVVPSTNTDGAVMASAAYETDGPMVGLVMAVNATTEYGGIWLCLPF